MVTFSHASFSCFDNAGFPFYGCIFVVGRFGPLLKMLRCNSLILN
jgi:hypothetical protein